MIDNLYLVIGNNKEMISFILLLFYFNFDYFIHMCMRVFLVIAKYHIPKELVLNRDQTGLPIFTSSNKTYSQRHQKVLFHITIYY